MTAILQRRRQQLAVAEKQVRGGRSDEQQSDAHRPEGDHPSMSLTTLNWLASSVADISDDTLLTMSRADLLEMIRKAMPWLPRQHFVARLPIMSQGQLRQLACLARRTCQLQTIDIRSETSL